MSVLGLHPLDRTGRPLPVADLEYLWPLGGWVRVEPVSGGKNEHYRLRTREGIFYLRRSHRGKARTELVAQLQLMRMLRLRGLPVPVAQPTSAGENHAVVQDRIWIVTRAIDGEGYDDASPAHLQELGRTLARYHDLTEDLDGGHGGPRLVTELRDRALSPGTPATMATRARQVADSLAELTPDLPRGVVHGGARRGSLVFRGDRVVGVLDFDSAHPDVRVLDLAVATHDVGKVYTEAGAADHKVRIDLDRVRTLLAAYTETRPLAPAEAAALPLLLEAKRLKRALGRVQRDRAGEALSANDHAKIALEESRIGWLDEHRDALSRTCASFVGTPGG